MNCLSLRCKNNNVVDIQQDRLCLFAVSWGYLPPLLVLTILLALMLISTYPMIWVFSTIYNSYEFHDNHYMNIFLTNAFLLCTAKLGNNLTKNIPNVNKSLLQYLTAPSQDSFFLFFTTTGEIEINIIGLNANKFTGPYSIPVAILKLPNMLYLHL